MRFAFTLLMMACCAAGSPLVVEVTQTNYEQTVARAPFCVVLYHTVGCEPCHDALATVQEAAAMLAERNLGVLFATVNVSNSDSVPRGVEPDPDRLGLTAYPAVRLVHYGRVNHKHPRVPRRTANELASWVNIMARPSSVELPTAAAVVAAIEDGAGKMPIVIGYHVSVESQYRLEELAEAFRGMAAFYHVPTENVDEVIAAMRNDAELRGRYLNATRQGHLVARNHRKSGALSDGKGLPRRNSFVVHKHQQRGDVDLFDRAMRQARKQLAGEAKKKRVQSVFDPLRADGGEAFGVDALDDAAAMHGATPPPDAIRGAGMTVWYHAPAVSSFDAFADRVNVEEEEASDSPTLLGPATVDRVAMLQFIARHVFPPVDVLTVHNHGQYNVRTPYLFFYFTKSVSADAADEMREQNPGLTVHGLHEERAFLLDALSELRFVASRLERLSDTFTNYSFLLCAYNENRQVFHQFGLDLDAYDRGAQNLIGVMRGEHKYVFEGPATFDARAVRAWLEDVEAGKAVGYKHSTPAPNDAPRAGSGRLGVVVFSTFAHVVTNNRSRDALLVFSHEDELSERILGRFEKLADAERGNDQVVIAAFEALHNDPPAGFEFESLPAVYFVAKGGDPRHIKPVLYDGDFTLNSIASFARTHASTPMLNTFGIAEEAAAAAEHQHQRQPDQEESQQQSEARRATKEAPALEKATAEVKFVPLEEQRTMQKKKDGKARYTRKTGTNDWVLEKTENKESASSQLASGVSRFDRV